MHARVHTSDGDPVVAEKRNQEILEPHTFAPKDLLALLRNLDNEICLCEMNLKDENDKQNKYKVTKVIERQITITIFSILDFECDFFFLAKNLVWVTVIYRS